MNRRRALATLGLVLLAAILTTVIVLMRSSERGGEAARALGPLPAGYRYVAMEAEEAEATTKLFQDSTGASDVAVSLVETPEELAPLGVTVVVLILPAPPDPRRLALQLERDVTLVDPKPKALAGQAVLSHEGDATLSSATLWVRGRLAILAYAATTAEVDGVVEALIAGGAWRATTAA